MINLYKIHNNNFMRIMEHMENRGWIYWISIISSAVTNTILNLTLGFVLRDVLNAIAYKQLFLLIRGAFTILLASILTIVLLPIFDYFLNKVIKQVVSKFRIEMYEHLLKLPISYFEENHSGDLISRVTNDIQSIENAYKNQIFTLIYFLLFGIGSMIAITIMNWKIGLVSITLSILTNFINIYFAKSLRSIGEKIQHVLSLLTQQLVNILSGIYILKIFNLQNKILEQNRENTQMLMKLSVQQTSKNSQVSSLNVLLTYLNFVGIIIFGGIVIFKNNNNDIGVLAGIAQLHLNLTNMYLRIGESISQFQISLAGIDRVFEFLDLPIEQKYFVATGEHDSDLTSNSMIEFKNVEFSYKTDDKVLNKVTFKIQKGQIAALVGLNGSGKSTIFKLIMGFYTPDKGDIYINQKHILSVKDDLINLIAYVPQDTYLFPTTIEENIRFGRPNATEEEIIEAAKLAYAHEFIMQLPNGYKTKAGERGIFLSGGQRQRITIARAILKNAPILLLDEATSALDPESEGQVQQAIERLIEGRTVIVITHKLSTINKADVIFVINKGIIVEKGIHKELIKKNGIYADLYKKRFSHD